MAEGAKPSQKQCPVTPQTVTVTENVLIFTRLESFPNLERLPPQSEVAIITISGEGLTMNVIPFGML